MKHFTIALIPYSLLIVKVFSFPNSKDIDANDINPRDPGSPLFLTPYIKTGNIEEARKLSSVEFPGFPEVKSYAGFFTVEEAYDSNQFFWYFPAQRQNTDQAVVLWLQGGPGASSLFGLFVENGPFEVRNESFVQRETHWAIDHHLIYIDNPVGAGFSFTNDSLGYCTNQTQVGEHLYSTMIQFFQLFPELQKFPFFISGESYAGKYVPALGHTIHKKNQAAKLRINLKGMMIGNGWSDPINQLDYGEYLYQIGLIDRNQKTHTENLQNKIIELINKEAWLNATNVTFELYNYIINCTDMNSLFSYIPSKWDSSDDPYLDLIQTLPIRKAIHVGNLSYHSNHSRVHDALEEDEMKSVAPWISELLEHYHILFYNGQVDIVVAYPLTVNFLNKLKFSASEEYLNANRYILLHNDENRVEQIVGYLKRAGKLTEVLIRDAGHMVPADKPEWIYQLILYWRHNIEGLVENITLDGRKLILNNDNETFFNQNRINPLDTTFLDSTI